MRLGILRAIARASAAGLIVATVCGGSAPAQEVDDPARMLPVRERERPGYDPVGGRLGSFLFYPSLVTTPFYDSNLFAMPVNPIDDTGVLLSPRLAGVSQFSRHELKFELGADRYSYRRQRSEDRTDLFARADGRLDIDRETVALATLEAGLAHQDRGSPDSPALAAEPVPVSRVIGTVTLNKTFNRFGLSLGTALARENYQDVMRIGGGILDQDFRDHIVYSLGGRGTYAWRPAHRIFADVRANWRRYDTPGALAIDSNGWTALAGLEFELTTLLHGELGLGYFRQQYDSPGLPHLQGPSYLANLIWNPTPLMTLTLTGERQVRDSAVVGAAGRIESTFAVVLDYELLRNVIVSPRLRFVHEDYASLARTDTVVQPALKLEYLINRYLALGAEYAFTARNSDAPGLNYDRHQASIHAKAQF